jgi:hypothetical protein
VTAGPQGMSGPVGTSTVFRQTLAWVAVYEDLGGGAGTCPAGTPPTGASVTSAHGSAVLWTEDQSARALRRRAGVSP